MKISYNWLCSYLNINPSAEQLDVILTGTGLEVEGIEKIETVKGGLNGVVVADVVTCVDHPNSDHLHLTTLDTGCGELLKVVCGAPNVAAGQKVFVATIGTKLYYGEDELVIKKGKIRGEESFGMICSERELGLGESHDGIMVLNGDIKAGTTARDYLGITDDYVIEIGLTPNRTDAMSHVGVARDLVAGISSDVMLKGQSVDAKVVLPDVSSFDKFATGVPKIAIEIDNVKASPRYAGLTVSGVKVGESPDWLKKSLAAIGVRSINNIVDVTNFVLHEIGHPLHAFDVDKIKGDKIVVKTCKEGTKFKTLDGVERILSGEDLMICNAEGPMCIAGVFGGEDSGVNVNTKNIFIESAYFNPGMVRKTARRHGLQTDASFRYERGADINIIEYAVKRAALLIKEIADGEISEINDVYPVKINLNEVDLKYDNIFALIGKNIGIENVKAILGFLEFKILDSTADGLKVAVPSYRVDVTRESDVVEEILRIYGYNNIEIGKSMKSTINHIVKPDKVRVENMIADMLSSKGFYEIMNNSQTSSSLVELVAEFDPKSNVTIVNPLSSELDIMRRSLLFGGLQSVQRNVNRKKTDLKLYEFGRIYMKNCEVSDDAPVTEIYTENKRLALWTTGDKEPESWKKNSETADYYFLNSVVKKILKRLGLDLSKLKYERIEKSYFDAAVSITLKRKVLGEIGIVGKKILTAFDVKQSVCYADLDWDVIVELLGDGSVTFAELPKYPEVRRDLALLVDKSVTFEQLEKVAKQTESSLLKSVNLFDIYEGNKIGEGKKSYALSFILQSKEKTLTDDVIDKTMDRLVKAFASQLNAQVR